MLVKTVYI